VVSPVYHRMNGESRSLRSKEKSCSLVGYEMDDKINITRQIIIGGRNRYLLNSHNLQANQIQNLFHSVNLNVNNPYFIIMQDRIPKVINMKPIETLSMIEDGAGSRMYENEKCQVLRTVEKKQNKVDEINCLLSEEITPALAKRMFQLHVRYLEIEDDSYLVSRTEFSWKDESRCGLACLFVCFVFCT